jgi:ankyrin repeat protein
VRATATVAASKRRSQTAELILVILRRTDNLSDQKGKRAALEWAICRGQIDLVNHLIESGVNPNTPGRGIFRRALQHAVSSANFEIVKILLDSGADVNFRSSEWCDKTALEEAAGNNNVDLVHLLIAKGTDPNALGAADDASSSADEASSAADEASNAADGDYYDPSSCRTTALEAALDRGKVSAEIIQVLIEAGAHVNGPSTFYKGLPLQLAVAKGNVKAVQLLLGAGADVDGIGVNKATPLQRASETGNIDLIKTLLNARADINGPPAAKWGEHSTLSCSSS